MVGAFTEIKQVDKLRMLSARLGTTLKKHAQEESVELMRRLQKAVTGGFEKTFKAVGDLEARVQALEEKKNAPVSKRRNTRKNLKDVSKDTESQTSD
jgi:phosphoenolpyruvate carboxylase